MTLAGKLGIGPDTRVLVVGPAPDAVIGELFQPDRHPDGGDYAVIVAFNPGRSALDRHTSRLVERLTTAGGLWLCWPKRSGGMVTNIGEADVRAAGLAAGLVDNKVAAIDETWSALRFVRRLADRPQPERPTSRA